MSEPLALPTASAVGSHGRKGKLPFAARKANCSGFVPASFFFMGAIKTSNTPTVMRRHREDIFHTTCTVCNDFDRRDSSTAPAAALGMTITSVTLSGAIAESKGLELAEHAPMRLARALANPPSRPLDFARGDSLSCHVERRAEQFTIHNCLSC